MGPHGPHGPHGIVKPQMKVIEGKFAVHMHLHVLW
jgi:hypothetical protein